MSDKLLAALEEIAAIDPANHGAAYDCVSIARAAIRDVDPYSSLSCPPHLIGEPDGANYANAVIDSQRGSPTCKPN